MKDKILDLVLRRLAEGYAKQLPLYEKMYQYALEQEKNLQNEEVNTDSLVEIITARREFIETIEILNKDINQLKKEICLALNLEDFQIKEIKTYVKGPGINELEVILEKLVQKVALIKEVDQKNEQILHRHISETKDKLTHIQNSKKANKAYQTEEEPTEGFFIDFSK